MSEVSLYRPGTNNAHFNLAERCRARREHKKTVQQLLPERPGHSLALIALQGYLARKKAPTPLGPPEVPRHRPTVGS